MADTENTRAPAGGSEPTPVAWLVTGGRAYVDRAFTSEASADRSITERNDGARKVPLYASAPASAPLEPLSMTTNQSKEEGSFSGGANERDLDPRMALDYARRMKAYCESFDGRGWAMVMTHGSVDEQNLAHALDNLIECAAMLMNMADRVKRSEGLLSDMDGWLANTGYGEDHPWRITIRRALSSQSVPSTPLTEERIATLAKRHMLETPQGWSMADLIQVSRAVEREVLGGW